MPAIAQVEPITTARVLSGPFDYRLPDELRDGAVAVGSMLVVPFGRRQVLGVVVGLAERSEIATEKLLAPSRALELGVPAEMVGLAEWVAAEYCSTLARALGLVLPPGASRRLGGRRRRVAAPLRHLTVGTRRPHPPALTSDQGAALRAITGELRARRAARRLLHGVTGSGKTEVYLRAAAVALEQGRGVIVLVPEIALTPQIVGRFIERFGDTVAVLHSRLRPSERYAEWRRLRGGEARVCVGPRSAVFAPIERPGVGARLAAGSPRAAARDRARGRESSSTPPPPTRPARPSLSARPARAHGTARAASRWRSRCARPVRLPPPAPAAGQRERPALSRQRPRRPAARRAGDSQTARAGREPS